MDPRGFPTTLPEFQRVLLDDEACARYLENLRWPNGFNCPECGAIGEPYRFAKRTSVVLRCRACHTNVSLTATTVMTHATLSVWFWDACLVTTQIPEESALQFPRQLGLSRYETAFQIFHKLRAGLVRPEQDTIGDQYPVEVDETLVGGRTKGEGQGIHHKTIVVGAVEVRPRSTSLQRQAEQEKFMPADCDCAPCQAGRGQGNTEFVQENVAKGTVVRTDGWKGYDDLAKLGFSHESLVLDSDPERTEAHLPMIHIAFSNLKTWLLGTHHGVSHQHLQAYLNEFVFRFNRRFYPMTSFNSALGLISQPSAPTYESIYNGE